MQELCELRAGCLDYSIYDSIISLKNGEAWVTVRPLRGAVKQITSQNLWPGINWSIKTARSAVSKSTVSHSAWFLFLRHQPRNSESVTLVARQREHFRGFWRFFWLLNSLKKGGVLIHKNSLASCQLVLSQRRVALWRVLSNKVIRMFGHCWVDIPHLHTSKWDSLFF